VQNPDGTWTFSWTSTGAPSYNIVLNGLLLNNTAGNTYTWAGTAYQTSPPPLEIVPLVTGRELALSQRWKPYLIMQWYGEPAAAGYTVQFFSGGQWVNVITISETGQWLYTYQTPMLTDETTYQFRVFAFDQYGNQSVARTFTRYVVTPPAPPAVAIGYNPLGSMITVSA
jgi:hypothetical protein